MNYCGYITVVVIYSDHTLRLCNRGLLTKGMSEDSVYTWASYIIYDLVLIVVNKL